MLATLLNFPSAIASITVPGTGDLPGHQRVQTLSLEVGWNAVFLEVEPLDRSPSAVFGDAPVDKVATLFRNPGGRQFITDPAADLASGAGWGVWYAPERPEAFLKSLDEVLGNRAYLIEAREACTVKVRGRVMARRTDWQPDRYNLVGFSVLSPGGPTFGQFFAASKAHAGQPIYRLVEGRWKKVLQPSGEPMRAGEAFWIYCEGASDYEGPLNIETALSEGLVLGRGGSELVLRNRCGHPLEPAIEHVAPAGPGVPLSVLVRTVGDLAAPVRAIGVEKPAGAWQQAMPPLEPGAGVKIPFECRASEMGAARVGSLLKITTDLGTIRWIPVTGYRDDLGD